MPRSNPKGEQLREGLIIIPKLAISNKLPKTRPWKVSLPGSRTQRKKKNRTPVQKAHKKMVPIKMSANGPKK